MEKNIKEIKALYSSIGVQKTSGSIPPEIKVNKNSDTPKKPFFNSIIDKLGVNTYPNQR
jgi:hypothetical protein